VRMSHDNLRLILEGGNRADDPHDLALIEFLRRAGELAEVVLENNARKPGRALFVEVDEGNASDLADVDYLAIDRRELADERSGVLPGDLGATLVRPDRRLLGGEAAGVDQQCEQREKRTARHRAQTSGTNGQ